MQHYDVTEAGNFEGHNILNRLKGLPRSNDNEAKLAMLRDRLFMLREGRIRPGLDDKVLADWNGLMIAALANAGAMLGEPSWVEMAARAFDFIVRSMTRGRPAEAVTPGARARLLLSGVGLRLRQYVRAALALFEATGQGRYPGAGARPGQRPFDAHYAHPGNGGYFLTADDAEGLVVRPAATTDDATPNQNSIAAQNLVRLQR